MATRPRGPPGAPRTPSWTPSSPQSAGGPIISTARGRPPCLRRRRRCAGVEGVVDAATGPARSGLVPGAHARRGRGAAIRTGPSARPRAEPLPLGAYRHLGRSAATRQRSDGRPALGRRVHAQALAGPRGSLGRAPRRWHAVGTVHLRQPDQEGGGAGREVHRRRLRPRLPRLAPEQDPRGPHRDRPRPRTGHRAIRTGPCRR